MEEERQIAYLALQAVEGLGPVGTRRLMERFECAEAVFKESEKNLMKIEGMRLLIVKSLKSARVRNIAEKEFKKACESGTRILIYEEADFPAHLKNCPDAPILLFLKGKNYLNERRSISIVGTRKMTHYGKAFLNRFMKELKEYNPVVVSGLAYGVDVCSHRLALDNGMSTIGVLAHGMDRLYPKGHERIARDMIDEGGLMTEFRLGTVPVRENFVKRNRIIAGLTEATIVIESSSKGGSLITAEMAASYFREVFAVPGRTTDRTSEGCNNLIKTNRASVITRAKDLEFMLNWPRAKTKAKSDQRLDISYEDPLERIIHEILRKNGPMVADELSRSSGKSVDKILPVLLQLELKGLISCLSGNLYESLS